MMENRPRVDDDWNLWMLLFQVRDAIFKVRSRELVKYGITAEQGLILLAVKVMGGSATPAQIARFVLHEPHTVSGILNRMGAKGLIVRKRNTVNKHIIDVVLTEQGQRAFVQWQRMDCIHKAMAYLSKEKREQLRSCLLPLRRGALKILGVKYSPPFPPL